MNQTKESIAAELLRVEEDCTHSSKAHFNAAERWARYHYYLGIPCVVISSLAGISAFKECPIFASLMAILVAILTALITFLKPSEISSSHTASGNLYLALKSDARKFRNVDINIENEGKLLSHQLSEFTERRNNLNSNSRQFSKSDFLKAKAGIDAGESLYEIDKIK